MNILLPISKSIANRVLIRQAYLGLPLMEVDPERDPDDVIVLHDALTTLLTTPSSMATEDEKGATILDLQNCGTAVRFLTAFIAQKPGAHAVVDGCERMRHRPIGQLVDALRALGADITYLGEEGFPPLEIHGKPLPPRDPETLEPLNPLKPLNPLNPLTPLNRPLSTQYISAMLLVDLPVSTDVVSPYIDLTRDVIHRTDVARIVSSGAIERDWSAAAFWLERWALGLCEEPEFPGLKPDSLQGDKVCLPLFRRIRTMQAGETLSYDFASCPDLYPAVAIACEQKKIRLDATGTESLRIKESDRLAVIEQITQTLKPETCNLRPETFPTYGDHRIAMALLAANLPCDDTECIRKSYPLFVEQLKEG